MGVWGWFRVELGLVGFRKSTTFQGVAINFDTYTAKWHNSPPLRGESSQRGGLLVGRVAQTHLPPWAGGSPRSTTWIFCLDVTPTKPGPPGAFLVGNQQESHMFVLNPRNLRVPLAREPDFASIASARPASQETLLPVPTCSGLAGHLLRAARCETESRNRGRIVGL